MDGRQTELRAVYQVGGEIYQKIEPLVCAIPSDDWRLNVNTIEVEQAPILVAMFSPNLSSSDAVQLIEKRPFDGWDSVDEFLAESELTGLSDDVKKNAKGYLGVDSSFFELDAQVLVDDSRVRIRSLCKVQIETVTVVRRRFGGSVSEFLTVRLSSEQQSTIPWVVWSTRTTGSDCQR